ncbi:conserved hypothetical protein [Flavobacterium sp. 9AF]|uniref:DUF4268 domain-containing protein n=1 Tax=Flavobacterium sp. 9AF TaxID=2653142 RepID=UPI0012F19E59|nr:DUF4268 domain-containing protein [Flavobacterium sp. 9AF]VXC16101.1 conserved hypothetical protein [Flavobacterium sp. 9AF]
MYSKEEALQLKKDFWTSFSENYPRKWLLYNTKIKDFSFKFYIDNKKAQVILEIEPKEETKRKIYYEKVYSLKNILLEDFIEDVIFEQHYTLDNGKVVSRIWVEKANVSINNKNCWEETFDFFYEKMDAFERFFYEYEDYLNDLEINT